MKIVILVFIFSIVTGLILYLKDGQEPFDQGIWKQSSHCKPAEKAGLRIKMINDLTSNILKERNREEIVELLGQPEGEKALPNIKRSLLYCVGRSYGLTVSWFIIHLDGNKIYKDFEIIKAD